MIGNTRPIQATLSSSSSSSSRRKKAIQQTLRFFSSSSITQPLLLFVIFLSGCFFSTTVILYSHPALHQPNDHDHLPPSFGVEDNRKSGSAVNNLATNKNTIENNNSNHHMGLDKTENSSQPTTTTVLSGKRILIAIASFDFSQFPLLEEVLDAYQDLCFAGASKVHIYIHTTVPYTVALIDLMNSRLQCDGLQIYIVVKTPALRLNLVDCHRTLFYEKVDEYDVFIYSEDDILVKPTTVATYLQETLKVQKLTSKSPSEDYNIGIVRYEYNYPPDVIINDKTRHATENVTRVYWEHLWKPMIPKSVHSPNEFRPSVTRKEIDAINTHYVTMDNAHQGMFLATADLLKAWRDRPGCEFNVVRQRPGKKGQQSQPTEGTQRVWMSSRMLHGKKHCNVQQLLPVRNFGQLTVWHLPNKNYRRVGKKGRIGGDKSDVENEFGTGKEKFIGPDPKLPSAMELHLQMRKTFGYPIVETGVSSKNSSKKYNGIIMLNELDLSKRFRGYEKHITMVDDRMQAYSDYVTRGGQMADVDYQNWKYLLDRD